MEWFLADILVTKCRGHMGFSALDLGSKLWHLIFLHLITFLVTLTFNLTLPIEILGCLEPLAYLLATNKMKTCNHCMFGAWTFYIGFNGQVPDEYSPDAIRKNWLYLNHTISLLCWYAKLRYSSSSSFRVICNKPFHKIRQQSVRVLPTWCTWCIWCTWLLRDPREFW